MRVLGPSVPLAVFRWDLVYLAAELVADDRSAVQALAAPIQKALDDLRAQRDTFEQTEDSVVVALAALHRRDRTRDALLVVIGATARATDKPLNDVLFGKLNPSKVGKLGIDAESLEIDRIVGELQKLDSAHPLRVAYLATLEDAQTLLVKAKTRADSARVAMALARTDLDRFKVRLDDLRLATHGQLVTILKDKAEADAFYRPAAVAPEEKGEAAPAKPATPPAPGTPPAAPATPGTPV